MKDARDIIIAPIISENSTNLIEKYNTYTFKVLKSANKIEIKKAIEEIFKVKVLNVNTINVTGKRRRVRYQVGKTPDWKKAMIKLAEGDEIEVFAGV